MENSGTGLLSKADKIINVWNRNVRRNIKKSNDVEMTYETISNRLPMILSAVDQQLSEVSVPGLQNDSIASPQIDNGNNSLQIDSSLDNPQIDSSQIGGSKRTLLTKDFSLEPLTHEGLNLNVELGFDINEMLREFSMLRELILTELKADFSAEDVSEAIVVLRQVDDVLRAIATSAAVRYAEYQLERIEPMHRELLSSNQELIRLVEAQKDNASHLAHELKNPIHAIISFSSMLLNSKKKAIAKSKQEVASKCSVNASAANNTELRQLERINENGKLLSQLVNNMLEVSRKESQALSLDIEQVDVRKLITRIVDSLASEGAKKNVQLIASCQHLPIQVSTDSLRLQQIIVNLVTNAIRYTDHGSVQVSCCSVGDTHWQFSVCDTGKGIEPDQQTDIFEPYVRLGEEQDYAPDSNGLGLTIVSKLTELLQGEIKLISTPGKGSTFIITLPVEY